MKVRSTNSLVLAFRPRPLLQTTGLIVLLVTGIVLMSLHHGENAFAQRMRTATQTIIAPVINLLSSPANYMRGFGENVQQVTQMHSQNQALREENAMLLKWQTVAQKLERENKELRSLLGIKAIADARYVTAHIVSKNHDPISHTLLVRHSGDQGIRAGLPVVAAEGIIGHVLETSGDLAKILLITDRQSRIPVEHETSGERGILVGTNNATVLQLNHVERPSAFDFGDRLVTSSSKLFPVNMVVGEVGAVHDDTISIKPYSDTRKLHFVSIVIPEDNHASAQ